MCIVMLCSPWSCHACKGSIRPFLLMGRRLRERPILCWAIKTRRALLVLLLTMSLGTWTKSPLALLFYGKTVTVQVKIYKMIIFRCSYLEIYNEKINDLLHSNATDLKIREDVNQGVHVIVKEEIIQTPDDLFTLMKKGMKTRKVGSTDMNERSSRSHSIFKLVSHIT